MTTTTEQEIRAVIDERVAAVQAKDAGPLAAREADDVVSFDVLPPLNARGKDAVAEKTKAWFDSYASAIGYDVEQLEIHASEDVAFCSFVYHVSGTLVPGDAVSMWVRATLGLRRIDGDWRIVHDHESVPWDPQTGQGLIGLSPTGSRPHSAWTAFARARQADPLARQLRMPTLSALAWIRAWSGARPAPAPVADVMGCFNAAARRDHRGSRRRPRPTPAAARRPNSGRRARRDRERDAPAGANRQVCSGALADAASARSVWGLQSVGQAAN